MCLESVEEENFEDEILWLVKTPMEGGLIFIHRAIAEEKEGSEVSGGVHRSKDVLTLEGGKVQTK